MSKVAIYARFSSQMQREASIEDQVRLCKERADREGWSVIDVFSDMALSGATMLRPGLQSLMDRAGRGDFDIVLAEALDRLSRDQADVATLFKRLSFHGVQIVTLTEGEVSELHVGLKGTMKTSSFSRISPRRQDAACAVAWRQAAPAVATVTAMRSCAVSGQTDCR